MRPGEKCHVSPPSEKRPSGRGRNTGTADRKRKAGTIAANGYSWSPGAAPPISSTSRVIGLTPGGTASCGSSIPATGTGRARPAQPARVESSSAATSTRKKVVAGPSTRQGCRLIWKVDLATQVVQQSVQLIVLSGPTPQWVRSSPMSQAP